MFSFFSESKHRVIVFCTRCLETNFVAQFLIERGYEAVSMTGRAKQADRKKALDQFIRGSANILVATDVASRCVFLPKYYFYCNCQLIESLCYDWICIFPNVKSYYQVSSMTG